MKKIYLILAVLCTLAITSCKGFLDVPPTDSASAETSITNKTDAEIFMNGVMNKLCSSSYLGRNMFMYADTKGGELSIVSAGRGMDSMFKFNQTASGTNYSGFWSQGFNIILQLNNIIESCEALKKEESTTSYDNILGQAYTLRAMVYFDLVRLYGRPYNYKPESWGVPNIVTRIGAGEKPLRATVAENYAQIVSDMTEGAKLISKSKTNGKINYYGNKLLQSRVYLHMDNFSEALNAAEDVINHGGYTLYENNQWVDSWGKQFGSESIFELVMDDTTTGLSSSSLGGYYARYKDYGNVLGYFVNSGYHIERMEEDMTDVRWGIYTYDEISTDRMGCCYKYLGGVSKKGDGKSDAGNVNIKVMRLSEAYLNAAEAALKLSTPNKAKAAGYLQEIRKRAPGLEAATAENITEDMIFDERAKELHLEGHRFFDMLRTGKTIVFDDIDPAAGGYMRGPTIDRTSYLTVLPVPQRERNINSELQQNEGYN